MLRLARIVEGDYGSGQKIETPLCLRLLVGQHPP